MLRKIVRLSYFMVVSTLISLFFLGQGAFAAEITDASGQVITFHRPFTRIISLYSAHTENILAMGGEDVLIGASKTDMGTDIPRFSYHDGTERFLAARPDLVLIRPMIERGYGKLMASLEARGITVISLQPATVDEMMEYWIALGVLSGREVKARGMVADFKAETNRIQQITDGLSDKRKVFFEAMHGKLRTFSQGSMGAWALTLAGGVNVAEDATPSKGSNIAIYGKERLLAKGRRIDVYLVQEGRMNRVTREEIEQEPGFSLIRAVRDGQIHFVDEALVSRPTPALLKGVRCIGHILYPTLFKEITRELADNG